jgi:hypothetical protein
VNDGTGLATKLVYDKIFCSLPTAS